MTYVKGTFYAFITAILYALVSIFSKVLDERHRSIYFALLSAYVMLWIVFAPLQVIERHQEGGEEKVNKIGKMTSDKVIRYDQSEGVEKKLRRHKMRHVVGAFVSMAALLFLIVCDSLEVNEEGNNVPHPDKNPRLGDALAFFAAICFSATNILQEYSIDSGVIEHHDVMIYILTSVTLFASFASAYRALKYVDAGTFNVVLLQQSLLVGLVRFFGFEGGFSSTTQAVIFVGTFTVQAIGILVYATAGDVKHREEILGSESEKRSILLAAAKQ
ncbi:unnamed protein product [Bathycoccus prasinos]